MNKRAATKKLTRTRWFEILHSFYLHVRTIKDIHHDPFSPCTHRLIDSRVCLEHVRWLLVPLLFLTIFLFKALLV